MRTASAVLLLATVSSAGCAQRSTSEEVEVGAFDPRGAIHETADATRIEVHRKDVPLDAMPIVAATLGGLPMAGLADVEVTLAAPKGQLAGATGSIVVGCGPCTLGDGKTALGVRGQQLPFGHIQVDRLDARVDVGAGTAELTRWELHSRDLELGARLKVSLGATLDASTLDGCVWFKPDPELLHREPKTYAVVMTTGGTADSDGYFSIKVGGTVGEMKLLAKACRVLPSSAGPTPGP